MESLNFKGKLGGSWVILVENIRTGTAMHICIPHLCSLRIHIQNSKEFSLACSHACICMLRRHDKRYKLFNRARYLDYSTYLKKSSHRFIRLKVSIFRNYLNCNFVRKNLSHHKNKNGRILKVSCSLKSIL